MKLDVWKNKVVSALQVIGFDMNSILMRLGVDSYTDVAQMLSNQGTQANKKLYIVINAIGDTTLNFPPLASKKHAIYRYSGGTTGTLNDYHLVSAPYSVKYSKYIDLTDNTTVNLPLLNEPLKSALEKIDFSVDRTLRIDNTTRILSTNLDIRSVGRVYNGGAKTIVLPNYVHEVIYVSVNGVLLEEGLQWNTNPSTQTTLFEVTITDPIKNGSYISARCNCYIE